VHHERDSAFIDYWKITEMEVWAPAYIDLVVPGFLEFQHEERHLMRTFQFGTVSGGLHCRLRDVGGESFVEWSWQGQNDTDPGCGRGWATLVNGELVGRDGSSFMAATIPPSEPPDRLGPSHDAACGPAKDAQHNPYRVFTRGRPEHVD
jgi:hypothetical protein